MSQFQAEVAQGARFEFGKNWQRYLHSLSDSRIAIAEQSLREMLEVESLAGKTFLDAGCGSGLFSLAARRLGARVHSFDFDPQSVGCAMELKRIHFPDSPDWQIEPGSVLDADYLASLGTFDVVYSWGVLHHTGAMWRALELVQTLVAPDGKLFISIYNDQGWRSRVWRSVKRAYNRLPRGLRFLVLAPSALCLCGPSMIRDLARGRPFYTWRTYGQGEGRGMSAWTDVVDWVGGYPFEVARPDELFDYYRQRSFEMLRMRTPGSIGCNEFVFRKTANSS